MGLVTLKQMLEEARTQGYAVGSFNMLSIENVRGAIKAAEELNSPVILQLAEVHMPMAPIEYMAPVMLEAAKSARVPVVVHFDHGTCYDSVVQAIKLGFSSVMFDGASNPLEENIKLTKEIVKLAHSMGITAEAELGQVGGTEDQSEDVEATLTDVEEARKFAKETSIDALAISIGNLHGEYKTPPALRFDRLSEISNAIPTPLVLHGGSGISEAGFRECIERGICKVNIGTAIQLSSTKKVKEVIESTDKKVNYFSIAESIIQGSYEAVKEHINIFRKR